MGCAVKPLRLTWFTCFVFATFWAGSIGLADDLFVHNRTGHDGYTGLVPRYLEGTNGPLRTIQGAILRANPGDRIVLLPTGEPYHEEVVIHGGRARGWERFPIIIEGNGVELVGSRPLDAGTWEYLGNGLYQTICLPRVVGVLSFGGAHLERMVHPMWSTDRPEPAVGQYAHWRGSYLFRVDATRRISDYALMESRLNCGLLVFRAPNLVIRNLRVRGFRLDAVQVRGPVQSVRFENCLFADNGRAGVSLLTNSRVELSNCFLENNVQLGALSQNFSALELKSCTIAGSPNDARSDSTSRLNRTGGQASPLPAGPLVIPEGFEPEPARPAIVPKPREPEEPVQKPGAKSNADTKPSKSFFDQ
jgi:hypothetical protein